MMHLKLKNLIFIASLLVSKLVFAANTLQSTLVSYDNFPKAGVQFVDISPALRDPDVFNEMIDKFATRYANKKVDVILGLEARGFVLGSALAYKLKIPFVMARKPGKLPGETISATFYKEYGKDTLVIQKNSIKRGDNVVIVDDLIATGGTAMAAQELVTKSGAKVLELAVVIELSKMLAENKKFDIPVFALQKY